MANYNFLDFSKSNPNPSSTKTFLPIGEKLKVGLVGVGKRVRNQILPLLNKNSNFEVTGFWTRSQSTREKFHAYRAVKTSYKILQSPVSSKRRSNLEIKTENVDARDKNTPSDQIRLSS